VDETAAGADRRLLCRLLVLLRSGWRWRGADRGLRHLGGVGASTAWRPAHRGRGKERATAGAGVALTMILLFC
jgi:hypothetical protein